VARLYRFNPIWLSFGELSAFDTTPGVTISRHSTGAGGAPQLRRGDGAIAMATAVALCHQSVLAGWTKGQMDGGLREEGLSRTA
jgi:hypothetical protein